MTDFILSKYPSKYNKDELTKNEYVKLRTVELYDYLPQATSDDPEEVKRVFNERGKYIDIRNEVIQLNYTFFGYVASTTYITNTSVSYEDKFQSALQHFMDMWHKYRFAAKYRMDLSFGVFFKPRLSEEIRRELNTVKYSVERNLKMKAAAQIGKKWTELTYEDLNNVHLSETEMNALKAMFGCTYWADMKDHETYIQSDSTITLSDSLEKLYSKDFKSIKELLMHIMVENASMIDDLSLLKIAQLYDIPFETLKKIRPEAEADLKAQLIRSNEIHETFRGY